MFRWTNILKNSAVGLLGLIGVVGTAWAADGVLEINQACAAQGCFAGDAADLPVTITEAGSYRLTGNLSVPDENTTGILVQASGVTLDLGGFSIQGVTTCTGGGASIVCAPLGTGRGVRAESGSVALTVRDGVVIGMGDDGVSAGTESTVERLRVEQNGGEGIVVGNMSIVTDSQAHRNGRHGIDLGTSSRAGGCTAQENGFNGIDAGSTNVVESSTAQSNGFSGISLFSGLVRDCTARDNEFRGISAQSNSSIIDNVASSNGTDGIGCLSGCRVHGNVSRGNSDFGLQMNPTSVYSSNVVTSNTNGGVDGGESRGSNYCNGNNVVSAFCP